VNADLDTRFDHRVLDLRKPEVRRIFELRASLLAAFRSAFVRRGFIEVETPKILQEGAEGGATMFGVDYFEKRAFLAQSPQLYKQMLMAADFDRVFEIAPAFRAEPSDTVRHITEFTSLDAEAAYIDDSEGIREILEAVVIETFAESRRALEARGNPLVAQMPELSSPFPRIPFPQVEEWLERPGAEQDLGTDDEKRLGDIVAERFGVPMYFITDFPSSLKRSTFYAQRYDDRPAVTGYFDLDFRGLELASGGMREHRYDRLVENMRAAGVDPARFAGYLEAFRYGMPRHGGFGFGVDRLVWKLADVGNIREVRLFPRDRYRLTP
jgi:aspartyl-tRNA synthetase